MLRDLLRIKDHKVFESKPKRLEAKIKRLSETGLLIGSPGRRGGKRKRSYPRCDGKIGDKVPGRTREKSPEVEGGQRATDDRAVPTSAQNEPSDERPKIHGVRNKGKSGRE